MKKIIKALIISVLVIPSLFLVEVEGVSANTAGRFLGCTAGGAAGAAAGGWVADQVERGRRELSRRLGGGVGAVLGGPVPVKDDDLVNKETALDIVARCIAREILSKMTGDALNIVRTGGRDGGVSWVKNWRNQDAQAQARGEGVFRAILSNTRLCSHISNDVKDLFGVNSRTALGRLNIRVGDIEPFTTSAGCTMPNNFSMSRYEQNFAENGGWAAFSRLVEPQNNFTGVLAKSLSEIGKQVNTETSADRNEAISGRGLIGHRGSSPCLLRSNNVCIMYADIKTPGSIMADNVSNANKAELDWVVSSDEMSELVGTAVEILFNRMLDLSNPNEGDYVIPGSITLPEIDYENPEMTPCFTSTFLNNGDLMRSLIETAKSKASSRTEHREASDALRRLSFISAEQRSVLRNSERLGAVESLENFILLVGQFNDYITNNSGARTTLDFRIQVDRFADSAEQQLEQLLELPDCSTITDTPPPGEPQPSLLEDIVAERNKYTTLTINDLGKILNKVAWDNKDAGWGLSRKEGGHKCSSPVGNIACDILHHKPTNTLYDVFANATTDGPNGETLPGSADPMWSMTEYHNDPNRPWVAPVQP